MKSKTSVPMDDGTASSEGEESIDFIDTAKSKIENVVETVEKSDNYCRSDKKSSCRKRRMPRKLQLEIVMFPTITVRTLAKIK